MELKDLVPPLELCAEIPDGKFKDSALVWCEDEDGLELVMPREIAEFEKEGIPAPTLQEFFDELSENGNCFSRRGELGWITMFEIPGDEEGYGYEDKTEHDKTNHATAALKLWLEVNKPDTPDRNKCKA